MCSNQLGRRNITDEQKTYLLGKLNEARKNSRGGQIGNANASKRSDQSGPSFEKGKTAEKIAREYGVGYGTVVRAEHFSKGLDSAEEVSPGIREFI